MKLKRLSPGYYVGNAVQGECVIHYITDRKLWYLTYPGQPYPDDYFPTLKEAKEALFYWMENKT